MKKPCCGRMLLTIAVFLCGLTQMVTAQPDAVANRLAFNSCASGNSSGVVAVNTRTGPRSLDFESSMGAMKERPKIFILPQIRALLVRL